MAKKRNAIVIIIVAMIILIVGVVIFLLLFFPSKSQTFSSQSEISGLQAKFYGIDGQPISNRIAQTGVARIGQSPQAGIFYVSFDILASNTGDVLLENLANPTSSPPLFTEAIHNGGSVPPVISDLIVGQTNFPVWSTDNDCSSNADCGTSEVCLVNRCLMPIVDYNGIVPFELTMEADFKDAFGVQQPPVQDNVILELEFTPEITIFRTNAITTACSGYNTDGTWVAFDVDADGDLEAFGRRQGGCNEFDCTSPSINPYNINAVKRGEPNSNGCGLFKRSNSEICLCYSTSSSPRRYTTADADALLADLVASPHEDFISINCGGIIPCQEVYVLAVAQPESCSDGIQNQDECAIDVSTSGGACDFNWQSPESSCVDGLDNDCDGLIDTIDTTDCPSGSQISRPISTINQNPLWTTNTLEEPHIVLDEITPNGDTDYISTMTSGIELFTIGMSSVIGPGQLQTGETVEFSITAESLNGKGKRESVFLTLSEGTQSIFTWNPNLNRDSYTTLVTTIPQADLNQITDYSNLRLQVIPIDLSSGEEIRITQIEIEFPER